MQRRKPPYLSLVSSQKEKLTVIQEIENAVSKLEINTVISSRYKIKNYDRYRKQMIKASAEMIAEIKLLDKMRETHEALRNMRKRI